MRYGLPFTRLSVLLCVLALCAVLLSPAALLSEGKRGDDPACQEECLGRHSERMGQLSKEYKRTRDKAAYQEKVDAELLRYSRCLNNCRELVPLK